jgi:hypothetical protein
MITLPVWMLWIIGGFIVLSCLSVAMNSKDRTLWGFTQRFLAALTFSAQKEMEQFHIPVPQIQSFPTDADVTKPPSAPSQN